MRGRRPEPGTASASAHVDGSALRRRGRLGLQLVNEASWSARTGSARLAATVLRGERLNFASGAEFYDRSDGLGPLQHAYGFQFGRERVVRLESDRVYQVLRDLKLIDVGMVFATDG